MSLSQFTTRATWVSFVKHAATAMLLIFIGTESGIAAADLGDTARFNIAPQALHAALLQYAEQSGIQVTSASRLLEGKVSDGVVGVFPSRDALEKVLAGTELAYDVIDPKTVVVRAIARSTAMTEDRQDAAGGPDSARQSPSKESFWHRFRLAQADRAAAADDHSTVAQAGDSGEKTAVEEIVVTAQKRLERLQDVPIPVTALSADALVNSNQLRLQDYYSSIPGLSLAPGISGQQFVVIRGITTGSSSSANPTVGVTVDDVPYGSSTGLGGGGYGVPDLDPSDLVRVEVLRGPQGTLYGASSMGGLLKYVTIDPSTDRVSGRVQAGLSDVQNGGTLGSSVRGSINIPLSDTLAIRASGFHRRDPGYIDNTVTGKEGVNRADADGGRVAALWRPSDAFSLKLGALIQHNETFGLPYAGSQDLQQNFAINGLVTVNRRNAYSAVATAKLGAADLTSVTGYSNDESIGRYDVSFFLTPVQNQATFGVAGTGSTQVSNIITRKFSQEIRLTAPIGQRVDALLGAFYTHENSPFLSTFLVVDPPTGSTVDKWVDSHAPVKFDEYAAFANLTFHLSDRFDLQIGGRQSENELESSTHLIGPYVQVLLRQQQPELITPEKTTKGHAFTYLLTPQFKMTEHLMTYVRLASGYRPGGPNATPGTFNGTVIAPQYEPDKTQNYELGIKGDLLDGAVSLDASLYYIDWKNIQIQLREPTSGAVYYANAGHAKSQGLELAFEARPFRGTSIAAWGAWNDAELKESLPATAQIFGAAGDRLPYSSRFSGNLSVGQEFSVSSSMTGFVGASVSYVGDRVGIFRGVLAGAPLPRQIFPAYTRTDVRAGLKRDTWSANLFVNNITDKRGVLDGGLGATYADKFAYIQPRTIGISLSKTFE